MKYPKPYGNKILVRRKKTSYGIIITNETENEGEIVSVGDGSVRHPMQLSVGQNIMFRGYGIKQIPLKEDKENVYLLIDDDDTLLVLD